MSMGRGGIYGYPPNEFPQGVLTPGFLEGAGGKPVPAAIAALMNEQPQAAPVQIDAPRMPEQKKPGFFGRIKQQPGGSRALMAMGANLLSSPDFFSGLGQGALAYQGVLDEEADKLKPKLTKDSTFTYSIDPVTGEPVFKRTPVADFEQDNLQTKLKANEALGRYRADLTYDLGERKIEAQDRWNERDNATRRYGYDKRYDADIAGMASAERIAQWRTESDKMLQGMKEAAASAKPPPVGAMKEFQEAINFASKGEQILKHGDRVLEYLENGEASLGFFANTYSNLAQKGLLPPNASTRAYAELQQFQQMLVNGILLDANGVQTDGDAIRARIMTMVSDGDNEGAARELRNVLRDHQRGIQIQRNRAENYYSAYRLETTGVRNPLNRPKPKAKSKPTVSNW